jgi:hypothetical protein
MWLAVIFGICLVSVCLYLGFRFVFPILFPLTMTVAVLTAIGIYCYDAGRVLLPAVAAGPSGVTVPAHGEGDPAYRHYLIAQVWRDWGLVLRSTLPKIAGIARSVLEKATRALLAGWQGLFAFPVWLAVAGGVVVAAVPLAAVGVVLAAGHLVVVAAGLAVWLLCVLVLRAVERIYLLVRRVVQACPVTRRWRCPRTPARAAGPGIAASPRT